MGVEGADDEDTILKGIEAMENFFRSINMPTSFRELGIAPTEAEMEEMARKCALACGGSQGSAKVLLEADMLAIYKMANAR